MRFPVLGLAIRSALNRRVTAALTMLAVALSVALFLGVEKIRAGAKASFESTISGTDLIVGARSGPVNLLLYSVFRLGDPTANISWESYQLIARQPGVAWTVPLSLGDSHQGYRVMGTDAGYFEHYRYGRRQPLEFAQGHAFEDVFEAVLGAEAARALGYSLGDEITVAHGLGRVSFAEHRENPFTVVGILRPTGTPVDRTVHVPLEGIEAIHIGWETGARSPLAGTLSEEEIRARDLTPDQITAFLIGLDSPVAALRLQRSINTYPGEALSAIMPGVALAQLWSVIGVAERTLIAVSAFVVLVGLTTVLISILTSLNERRREMAILRSLGARPWHIFALLVAEAAFLAFIGALAGAALVYGGLAAAAPLMQARFGVMLTGLGPGAFDLYVIGGVTLAAALMGLGPAWQAFRNSLADGLSIRL